MYVYNNSPDTLIWSCSGQDARVCEAGLEQGDDHKHKEASSNHRTTTELPGEAEGSASASGVSGGRFVDTRTSSWFHKEVWLLGPNSENRGVWPTVANITGDSGGQ
ncbi:hypothetical protein EYF80_003511 [Liparis tanakae]|uniref:Uncharacterized protein n=1 Tax=Liparis tanakae TaxID=230148 RepID=A0A4Z2J8B4_9TELE|nr:hypothetical protein EYF80_003511 [Liparis tanakae]